MQQLIDSQELARRFNEDEAVWLRFENRRRLRLQHGNELLIPNEILDELDWIAAERECREPWCVGNVFPTQPEWAQEVQSPTFRLLLRW